MGKSAENPLALLGFAGGEAGLAIFFFISGHLVIQSFERNTGLQFFKNRILRLFPGLIVSVLAGAFILGPAVTTLPLAAYFSSSMTWDYLQNATMFLIHYNLPGVFANNLYPYAVNGSTWSLPVESLMYCLLFLFGALGLIQRRELLVASILSALCAVSLAPDALKGIGLQYFVSFYWVLVYWSYFAVGIAFYYYAKKIPLSPWVLGGLAIACILSRGSVLSPAASLVFLAYAVYLVAYSRIPLARKITSHGDISYGMYLYAFPVQQAISHYLNGAIDPLAFFALAAICTLIPAALSWKFVESRALKLKGRAAEPVPVKISARKAVPVPRKNSLGELAGKAMPFALSLFVVYLLASGLWRYAEFALMPSNAGVDFTSGPGKTLAMFFDARENSNYTAIATLFSNQTGANVSEVQSIALTIDSQLGKVLSFAPTKMAVRSGDLNGQQVELIDFVVLVDYESAQAEEEIRLIKENGEYRIVGWAVRYAPRSP